MNPVYFETLFSVDGVPDWPAAFAIITAHATTGEVWSAEDNRDADARLLNALHQRGCWHCRITGYSPRTGHAEPGWAVALGFEEACDLGQQFRQDAIYYVQGDDLFVSHCDSRRTWLPVGVFHERLRSSNLPQPGE